MWQHFRYNILKVAKRTPSESNGPSAYTHDVPQSHTHSHMHTHAHFVHLWGQKCPSSQGKLEILIACNLKMK